MKNVFISGEAYNAAQKINPMSLANNNTPLFYNGLVFVATSKDENGFIEHEFIYEGESRYFDDDFVNNDKPCDNSMIIVLKSTK